MAGKVDVEEFDGNPTGNVLGAGGTAALVDMIQGRLNTMIGKSSGFLETLPRQMRARIEFLRELQDKHDDLYDEYNKELLELRKKYEALYEPLYKERSEVVLGGKDVPISYADRAEEGEEGEEAAEKEDPPAPAEGEGEIPTGIPEFWLGAMRAHPLISEHLSQKDEEILAHLTNIECEELEPEEDEDGDELAGFRLSFHFAKNPAFDHEILTKTYHIFEEDGEPILQRAEGTDIEWKPGKNPTVKVIYPQATKKKAKVGKGSKGVGKVMKKKAKPGKGGKGAGKVLTKTEAVPSFFNFFSPPTEPEEGTEMEEEDIEELREALEADFELGATFRSKLIPNAVRWYTGEANEDDEDDDEDYDEEDDVGDDDEDDDDDEDEDDEDEDEEMEGGAKPKSSSKAKAQRAAQAMGGDKAKPPECKQQ